jgi:Xaa-Pro aminopeptidase
MSEREICRTLQRDILARGADTVPYLIGASGPGSYDNIIMGPTDREVAAGDVMIIDTGATYDGYFCDFDRNWAFGRATDAAKRAHRTCFDATQAGLEAARPGATAADLWAAMWRVLEDGGARDNDVGRLGHGLGMQLTEGHSNMPGDHTVLRPGMPLQHARRPHGAASRDGADPGAGDELRTGSAHGPRGGHRDPRGRAAAAHPTRTP